jgi:hypothetical protein
VDLHDQALTVTARNLAELLRSGSPPELLPRLVPTAVSLDDPGFQNR